MKLEQTIDVYYSYEQLQDMVFKFTGTLVFGCVALVFSGKKKEEARNEVLTKLGLSVYIMLNTAINTFLDARSITVGVKEFITATKMYDAMLLLENAYGAKEYGVVRFRTKVYSDVTDGKTLYFVGDAAVTYNSNY